MDKPFISVVERAVVREDRVVKRIAFDEALNCDHQVTFIGRHLAAEYDVEGIRGGYSEKKDGCYR